MDEFNLSIEEKSLLLKIARASIAAEFGVKKPDFPRPAGNLKEECGTFVTLHKKGRLRGCIGQIIGINPLQQAVEEMSYASAFSDPRFSPLEKSELDKIDIEISVLTPLIEVDNSFSIEVGKHGIYIKNKNSAGILLPQVAVEHGWDRSTFLTHTCYKAGLPGDCWRKPGTQIFVFSALIFGETTL